MTLGDPKLEAARARWRYRGDRRPDFAEPAGAGEESVWDYPRPPRLEAVAKPIRVEAGTRRLAETGAAFRVLETASPPTFYLPPGDVALYLLVDLPGRSLCEWKGEAHYYGLERDTPPVAWAYAHPFPEFSALADYVSFYPGRVACFVDGRRVRPQPGGFYAGWLTDEIRGPVKGAPGSEDW